MSPRHRPRRALHRRGRRYGDARHPGRRARVHHLQGDAGGPAPRTAASGTLELVAIHHTAHQGGCLGQTASAQGATETRVDDIRTWITWNATLTQKTPVGHVDAVVPDRGQVTIRGWAWDPDTPAPTDVHIHIDGVGVAVRADRDRPGVVASHGTTPTRGYSHTRALAPGEHTACVYAINIGPGDNTVLGCRTFSG